MSDTLVAAGTAILLATAGCASTTTTGRTAATPDARPATTVRPAGPETASSATANSSAPAPDTRIGCTRATLPPAWRPGEERGVVIVDTTSDTEKQVDGEFRGILQSMTVADENAKR